MNRPDEGFEARRRYACFLGKVAVALAVAWFALVVLVGCATDFPPPPTCEQSANRELCELEQRMRRLEYRMRQQQYDAQARQSCEFAHGAGSILCQ